MYKSDEMLKMKLSNEITTDMLRSNVFGKTFRNDIANVSFDNDFINKEQVMEIAIRGTDGTFAKVFLTKDQVKELRDSLNLYLDHKFLIPVLGKTETSYLSELIEQQE